MGAAASGCCTDRDKDEDGAKKIALAKKSKKAGESSGDSTPKSPKAKDTNVQEGEFRVGLPAVVKATGTEANVSKSNGHAFKVDGKWHLADELAASADAPGFTAAVIDSDAQEGEFRIGAPAVVKASGLEGNVSKSNGHAFKVDGKWHLADELAASTNAPEVSPPEPQPEEAKAAEATTTTGWLAKAAEATAAAAEKAKAAVETAAEAATAAAEEVSPPEPQPEEANKVAGVALAAMAAAGATAAAAASTEESAPKSSWAKVKAAAKSAGSEANKNKKKKGAKK